MAHIEFATAATTNCATVGKLEVVAVTRSRPDGHHPDTDVGFAHLGIHVELVPDASTMGVFRYGISSTGCWVSNDAGCWVVPEDCSAEPERMQRIFHTRGRQQQSPCMFLCNRALRML